jgi:hypothetical protein
LAVRLGKRETLSELGNQFVKKLPISQIENGPADPSGPITRSPVQSAFGDFAALVRKMSINGEREIQSICDPAIEKALHPGDVRNRRYSVLYSVIHPTLSISEYNQSPSEPCEVKAFPSMHWPVQPQPSQF